MKSEWAKNDLKDNWAKNGLKDCWATNAFDDEEISINTKLRKKKKAEERNRQRPSAN